MIPGQIHALAVKLAPKKLLMNLVIAWTLMCQMVVTLPNRIWSK